MTTLETKAQNEKTPTNSGSLTSSRGGKHGQLLGSLSSCGDIESGNVCKSRRPRNCCCGFAWYISKFKALKKHPFWVIAALILMAAVIGLCVWGVVAAADDRANEEKRKALLVAEERGMILQAVLMGAMNPASIMASMISSQPFDLPAIEATFDAKARSILALEQSSSVFNIQIVPNGIIRKIEPIRGFEGGVGLDLMKLRSRKPWCKKAIRTRKPLTSGPELLPVGIWAFVALHPVFVSDVDKYESFNLPEEYGVPNSFNPEGSPSNSLYNSTYGRNHGHGIYDPWDGDCGEDLCYDAATRTKFWGFGKSVVSWEVAKAEARLYQLCGLYDFIMTKAGSSAEAGEVIAMCSDERMIATQYDDMWNGTVGHVALEDYLSRDPVSYTLNVFQNAWTLHVVSASQGMVVDSSSSSWRPEWETPLIVVVIVMPIVLAFLTLLLVAMSLEQEELLEDEMAARHLLEEEKKHTDALVVRQLNLISCLAMTEQSANPEDDYNRGGSIEESTKNRIEAVRRHLSMNNEGNNAQIILEELLGEGSFAKVFKGVWCGGVVAIKLITLPANMSGTAKREKMAIMEAAISTSMYHPNVVQTYTYSIRSIRETDEGMVQDAIDTQMMKLSPLPPDESEGGESLSIPTIAEDRDTALDTWTRSSHSIHSYEVRLVLEYCDLGCLRDALDHDLYYGDPPFNYHAVLDTCIEVAQAMQHLHMANVLHSDLKACNIMLKSTGVAGRGMVAKVADFGLSVSLDNDQTHMSQMFRGTPTHMAPEVLMRGSLSKAADVYSFGITMFEVFSGEAPFKDIPRPHLGHAITVGKKRPVFGLWCPDDFKELAEDCWQEDPDLRPTFKEVIDRLTAMRSAEVGITPPLDLSVIHKAMAAKLASQRQIVSLSSPPGSSELQSSSSGLQQARSMRGSWSKRSSVRVSPSLGSVPEGRESLEMEDDIAHEISSLPMCERNFSAPCFKPSSCPLPAPPVTLEGRAEKVDGQECEL